MEEYLVYESEISLKSKTGKPREVLKLGKIIGIKPNAPQWAQDQYSELVAMNEQALAENTKLVC